MGLGLPAAFGLFAIVYFALSFVPFIRLPRPMASIHLAMMFVGACLVKAPAVALSAAGAPGRYENPVDAFSFWNHLMSVGYASVIVSFALFVSTVIVGLQSARVRNQP